MKRDFYTCIQQMLCLKVSDYLIETNEEYLNQSEWRINSGGFWGFLLK